MKRRSAIIKKSASIVSSTSSSPTDDDLKGTKTIQADVSKYADWPFEEPVAAHEGLYISHTFQGFDGSLFVPGEDKNFASQHSAYVPRQNGGLKK
ncbi:hypothetical protein OUZ56_032169 [Daphnia magna]|uniref:Uncharacterized protein n=1 Tax=Daphnia magna TaxID=35525 RepID=A0ABQ9ZWC4_9CRUS|nr:hypothetical protein OUZ56_032169 [Daphnia magna]